MRIEQKKAPINCKKNCKFPPYVLRPNQRKVLVDIYQNEQKNNLLTSIKDLKNRLNLSDRKAYYIVDKLQKKELIKKLGPCYKITAKGKSFLQQFFGNLQFDGWYVNGFMDRAHKLTFQQPIIKRGNTPPDFTEHPSKKLNWNYPQLIKQDQTNNLRIQINPTSVVYVFKSRYGPTPHSIVRSCLEITFQYSEQLQKNGWALDLPKTTILEQHHALTNSTMANFSSSYKIFYKSDRLTFDSSISSGEFELISPEYSPDDFTLLTDFFEAIIRGDLKLNLLLKLQNKQEVVKNGNR